MCLASQGEICKLIVCFFRGFIKELLERQPALLSMPIIKSVIKERGLDLLMDQKKRLERIKKIIQKEMISATALEDFLDLINQLKVFEDQYGRARDKGQEVDKKTIKRLEKK